MASNLTYKNKNEVWFVYDGDCPICSTAARALQIKKSVGGLHLVNARDDKKHPLLVEINRRQLDLDEGMVLKYGDGFYHGEDALHMMALLGSGKGWFNRINALLFRSKFIASVCYPTMRATRNTLLRFKGVQKIRNLKLNPNEPLFKSIFGEAWETLPTVMKNHYAVRPFSDDVVKVEGHLDVKVSRLVSLMARLTGALLAHSGEKVPVSVVFKSDESGAFHFDRVFHFPEKGDIHFRSRMEWIKDNLLVEFMRFGVGWKLAYEWDGEKVTLRHKGYVWRVLGVMIPVPMALVLGAGHAEETPVSDSTFSMWTHAKHPLFGKGFAYAGDFKVTEFSCGRS